MADDPPIPAHPGLAALIAAARSRTPARVLVGRAGSSYRTETLLDLREDHASAVDAVHAEVDLARDLGREFVERWGLFEVATLARNKAEYLLRPDLGRRLNRQAGEVLGSLPGWMRLPGRHRRRAFGGGRRWRRCPRSCRCWLDGSEPRTWAGASAGRSSSEGAGSGCSTTWASGCGRPSPCLLIGERPGLATAESLSAYLAYRPGAGSEPTPTAT